MIEKKPYFEIMMEGVGEVLTAPMEEAKGHLEDIAGCGDEGDTIYTFKCVMLTDDEYSALPEFLGF